MSPAWIKALVIGWIASALIGIWAMLDYAMTPAATQTAQCVWPAPSRLPLDPLRPTLLMFIHPRCPCSRASLAELEIVAAKCKGRVAARIVFVRPEGGGDDWQKTGLLRAARRVSGAVVAWDANGVEASRFRATTSGEAFLYSPGGELLFQGGLTASRGHQGDNTGRSAVIALVDGKNTDCRRGPTYGCPLLDQVRRVEQKPELDVISDEQTHSS
jgi:hypothetical protein